jgi:hypothetical protein
MRTIEDTIFLDGCLNKGVYNSVFRPKLAAFGQSDPFGNGAAFGTFKATV